MERTARVDREVRIRECRRVSPFPPIIPCKFVFPFHLRNEIRAAEFQTPSIAETPGIFFLKHSYPTKPPFRSWLVLMCCRFMDKSQATWSLVETGIVNKPSTRLLLINGTIDGLMPIEDSMLLFEYGSPKEARFVTGRLHMGYPEANGSVYPWMEQVMKSVH